MAEGKKVLRREEGSPYCPGLGEKVLDYYDEIRREVQGKMVKKIRSRKKRSACGRGGEGAVV